MRRIYLDYHASTPIDPRVLDVLVQTTRDVPGNAHSRDHAFGDDAERLVESARELVAGVVKAPSRSVIFTSGATEALDIALWGFALAFKRRGLRARVVVSRAEHSAVHSILRSLSDEGLVEAREIPVTATGHIDLNALDEACNLGVDLAVVMSANNEVGTISDIPTIATIVHDRGGLLLSDAAQAFGKCELQVDESAIDMLTVSGHKCYGPKGIGALVVRPGINLIARIVGSHHERGLRAGTVNVPGVVALGKAAELRRTEWHLDEALISQARDGFQQRLQSANPSAVVNGDSDCRLAGNLSISFPGIPNQAVVARLRETIAVSTGAACTSGIETPSHVLGAMGLPRTLTESVLRFGLGKFVDPSDLQIAASLVNEAVCEVGSKLGL